MKAAVTLYIITVFLWPSLFQGEQVTISDSRETSVERVVLQLPWTHGMRFVGYYLAKEKGFYREASLKGWIANEKKLDQINKLSDTEGSSCDAPFDKDLVIQSSRWVNVLKCGFFATFGLVLLLGGVVLLLGRTVNKRTSELAGANRVLQHENNALARAERYLSLERDFASALVKVRTTEACYACAVEFLTKLDEVEWCGVMLMDRDEGRFKMKLPQNSAGCLVEAVVTCSLQTLFSQRVIQGAPFRLGAEAIAHDLPELAQEGLSALLVYPVRFMDEIIATFCLGSQRENGFPDHVQAAIEPMADMLRNAALREKFAEICHEREQNVKNLVENNIYAIAIIDEKGVLVFVNRLFESLSGYSAPELLHKPMAFLTLVKASQQEQVAQHIFYELDQNSEPAHFNLDMVYKSGKTIPVECAVRLIVWYDEPCRYIVVRDISDRIKSERKLLDSERLFRTVAEGAFDGVSLVDAAGVFLYVNERLANTTHYSVDELVGAHYSDFMCKEDFRRIRLRFERREDENRVYREFESRLTRRDGTAVPVSVSTREILLSGRQAFVITYKDISVRKRMERELLQIAEWERIRIAQDLHDTVGQYISGMAYLMEVLSRKLKREQSIHSDSAVELVEVARQAHQQLREVVKSLLPRVNGAKLAEALERLCVNMRVLSNSTFSLIDDGLGQLEFDAAATEHLRCIAQEASANAIRHGKAKNIVITLTHENGMGALRIDDDGCGFDVGNQESFGSGLKIMSYRADIIEGVLAIKRRENGGMSVLCTFIQPFHAADCCQHAKA